MSACAPMVALYAIVKYSVVTRHSRWSHCILQLKMSCYVPVLEKLKSAIINKSNNHEAVSRHKALEIRHVYPCEEPLPPVAASRSRPDPSLPRRETNGLTLTQNVGVFPRQVSLEIRHAHPALGLNEVAHQREHHQQENTCQAPCNSRGGVLSLGLPPNMMPRGVGTAKRQQSASSQAIHHYYETLSPKYANVMTNRSKVRGMKLERTFSSSLQIRPICIRKFL